MSKVLPTQTCLQHPHEEVRSRSGPGPTPRSGPLTIQTWTYYLCPGPPTSGPGPGHLGSGPVRTWVRKVQDRTLDSLH